VFADGFDAFASTRTLHPREARAAWCIRNCFGPALGSHTLICPEGHLFEQSHACRHRSCPRCAGRNRAQWIDSELSRLLPCPHFHLVFTLPHELLPLWEFNRECFIRMLFDAVRGCLLELLADPRHLGATPGLLMSLHTWGRNLSHHPHVHALVSAGGLTPNQRWKPTRAAFLLPLKPLQRLFSGKLLAALRARLDAAELHLPPRQPPSHWLALVSRLYRKHWNIQINPAYGSGRSVTLYLARYAKGGPLPSSRPLFLNNSTVSFDYTDHRDGSCKRLRLSEHEFIARILWHAPPKGVHTVRHAGLYATAARNDHRLACIALGLPCAMHPPDDLHLTPAPDRSAPPQPILCPTCNAPLQLARSPNSPRGPRPQHQISFVQLPPSRSTTSHLGPTPRSSRRAPACGVSLVRGP
jgi:Putative transposase/Transposase zinc-binding domain